MPPTVEEVDVLSQGQYAALVITMVLAAVISIAGSVAVVRISALKLNSTYQRFLFSLGLSNVVNCFFLVLHNFLIPRNDEDLFPWAVGSEGSCTAMGFFLNFGALMVAMFNCTLAVYFYISIRSNSNKREKEPEDVIGCFERCVYIVCIILPAAIAAAAAGTGNINLDSQLGLCVISTPETCVGVADVGGAAGPGSKDAGAVELCEAAAPPVILYIFQITVLVVVLITLAATTAVGCIVRSAFHHSQDLNDDTIQRLAAVSAQSMLYSFAFAFSFLWPTVAIALSGNPDVKSSTFYALHYMFFLLYPLQGLMNCIIYIRPRFQMLQIMYPNDSFVVVLRVALSTAGDPDEIEHVRGQIYGSAYQEPSVSSSEHSLASDLPNEVAFDPEKPHMSSKSLAVHDDDELDPEPQEKPPEDEEKST